MIQIKKVKMTKLIKMVIKQLLQWMIAKMNKLQNNLPREKEVQRKIKQLDRRLIRMRVVCKCLKRRKMVMGQNKMNMQKPKPNS